MTTDSNFTRTSTQASKFYKEVPKSVLKDIWGPKKNVTDIQKQHFTAQEDSKATDTKEIEVWADKAAQDFHKNVRQEWLKGYMKQYINTHAKGLDLYKI